MLRKLFALSLLAVCTIGLSAGCGSGPGEIKVDTEAKPSFGEGDGEIDGVKAPKGVSQVD